MRAAPALRIEVRPSPASNGVVALLAVLAAAAAAWWLGGRLELPLGLAVVTTLAACAAACLAARMTLPRRAVTLEWDARQWTLGRPGAVRTGDIGVTIDLGVWLLLRFRPFAAPRRTCCIALQRRGLEAHWHALRCAVYSPRPAAVVQVAAPNSKNDRP